jgi:hypothetical protein
MLPIRPDATPPLATLKSVEGSAAAGAPAADGRIADRQAGEPIAIPTAYQLRRYFMMKGTKAFPAGFGDDSALMFAGGGMRSTGSDRLVRSPASRVAKAEPKARAPEAEMAAPVAAAPRGYEQAWPTPTIRLGRRGFHFPPPPADPRDGTADEAQPQLSGVLLPATVVGLILAAGSYFLNVPF